ncbi:Peptidyl-prolyl cis-trans isomerase [Mycena indigotica]|uniref:peptidylprolyl isomerase n=1 Tax=Mycena indigotica TaxID=2126181 RepID=A0A8H6WD78_9AGAR|nr:Peptidyl-prolyl cis-trans isomerase [Mycena indigotica]KAF7312211.1 Peptidyl-prolyl cis-trans isomerase [Mycena indigotica]
MRPRVFLDWNIQNEPLGRVIFELFNDEAPRTCENFRALCTGEKGLSSAGIPLYYKNCISHRIIRDFMIQAGDFTKRNGQGGESIYGAPFEDENLDRPVDSPFLLCMANKGPNTNGSQFFITLRECPHLNGKHTVFGRVVRGEDVVLKLGDVEVDEKSRPLTTVSITNSGELELRKGTYKMLSKPEAPTSPESEEEREARRRRPKSKRSASEESERRHRKKSKKESRRQATSPEPQVTTGTRQETEEEYDARLEREENERIKEQKRKELERIKERYEREAQTNHEGVRYKGRGRMVFLDPGGLACFTFTNVTSSNYNNTETRR